MIISEPMTMLTDYALAGVTGWLGWLQFQAREAQTARLYWAASFAALAIGAALGGTYHGFASMLPGDALSFLWKATILAVGMGTFAMVGGSAFGTTTGTLRRLIVVVAVAKLIVYSSWIAAADDFIYVILDSGIAMAIVGALHAWSVLRSADRASIWMLVAVAVSALAAGLQASGYGLGPYFGHNDLYHVIQMVAMWVFYRGARQLRDFPLPSSKA